jgi:hypothetical protein
MEKKTLKRRRDGSPDKAVNVSQVAAIRKEEKKNLLFFYTNSIVNNIREIRTAIADNDVLLLSYSSQKPTGTTTS